MHDVGVIPTRPVQQQIEKSESRQVDDEEDLEDIGGHGHTRGDRLRAGPVEQRRERGRGCVKAKSEDAAPESASWCLGRQAKERRERDDDDREREQESKRSVQRSGLPQVRCHPRHKTRAEVAGTDSIASPTIGARAR